jgi:hypothetical protein
LAAQDGAKQAGLVSLIETTNWIASKHRLMQIGTEADSIQGKCELGCGKPAKSRL